MILDTSGSGGTQWPSHLSYLSAALFSAASGGTNLIYGWSKGTDIGSSLVWAAVSVGVSIVFALSWPALILSLDRKQWARAVMVLVALVVTGSYSVIAALGSASGGRMNAATEERAITEQRTRAQAAYDQARTAMANLAPSRPVAEVEALLALAKPTCRVTVLNGKRDTFCTPNASLVAEKARAQRRVELQAQIERANAALSEAPAHVANTDAVALVGYLTAIGIKTDTDTLNKLLTLLGVLVIEVGGGLSLAVGMALSEKPLGEQTVHTAPGHSTGQDIKETPAASKEHAGVHTAHSPPKSSRDRLLQLIRDAQGVMRTGHRALGEALDISATRTGQLLRDLAADGLIRVRAGKTGSVITLVPRLVGAS